MSLKDLIRKRENTSFATATVATVATREAKTGRTVATVATVAVANYKKEKPAPRAEVGADDIQRPSTPLTDREGKAIREYDGGLSREEAERMAVLGARADPCKVCAHFHKPGCSGGYCGADERKDDLPLAYGVNHPLRRLPDDLGESCPAFRLTAWRCH